MLLQRLRPMASLGMLPIPVFAAVVTSSSGHDAMLCASGHITTGFQLAALSTLVLCCARRRRTIALLTPGNIHNHTSTIIYRYF